MDAPYETRVGDIGSEAELESVYSDMVFEGRHNNSIQIGSRFVNPYITIKNNHNENNGSVFGMLSIGSILENQKIEKRIAITPEIAKKYISLGFDVQLSKNYGTHLGITDDEYKKIGVNFLSDDKEIINLSNIIVQLGLLSDDKSSLLKEDQTLIGVLNPYDNKEKLEVLKNKKIKLFSLELLPRITRAQSMDILSSQANLAGYKAVIEAFAFFENKRVTIDLELSFYPFYFATAIAMWLSVLAIILWFIQSITERNSK